MAPNDRDIVTINGFAFRDVTNQTTSAPRLMTYEEAYRWTLTQIHSTSSYQPKEKP